MTEASSYSAVLKREGMQPFLWMQFLNAFNDNVYKLVVSLLAVTLTAKHGSGTELALAGFTFVVPFLLFSGYAGQLADRFEKRTVVILTKALEIVAMLLAVGALASGRLDWMLIVLFLTATQAALFSPAKYGIVPELVSSAELPRANGLLEMSTFVAIILGTVAGSCAMAVAKDRPVYIGIGLVGVAVLGTLVSLRIVRTPAPAQQRAFSWNPLGDVVSGLGRLRRDSELTMAVLGTTFFWFLGALFQMTLLLFGQEVLHASETQTGLLMASLAVGIGVGSLAAGRLAGDRGEPGLVPLGAFGMAVAGFLVAITASLTTALLALALLGFMGGLFVVPLNATLQHRPAVNEKGRILATSGFINSVGILLASGVVWLLHERLHVAAAPMIGIAAGATLVMAAYSVYRAPTFSLRLLLVFFTHLIYNIKVDGREHIPQQGGALLVPNHVSYIDGFLVGASMQRSVRFLVTAEWYDRFGAAFRMIHAIRVPAGNRRSIVRAIELARAELKAGHVVCIFPEGLLTPDGKLGAFQRGLEKIVRGTGLPVIPVHLGGVWGSIFSLDSRASVWRSLRRLRFPIRVSFGEPTTDPSADDVRQAVSELAAKTEGAIGKDLDAKYLREPVEVLTQISGTGA